MHRLRTTVARLRPLTAAQTAQTLAQPGLLAIEGGLRTFQPVRRQNTSVAAEPFLNGTSSNYVEEMYYAWLENPRNVHKVVYLLSPQLELSLLIHIHKTGSVLQGEVPSGVSHDAFFGVVLRKTTTTWPSLWHRTIFLKRRKLQQVWTKWQL